MIDKSARHFKREVHRASSIPFVRSRENLMILLAALAMSRNGKVRAKEGTGWMSLDMLERKGHRTAIIESG